MEITYAIVNERMRAGWRLFVLTAREVEVGDEIYESQMGLVRVDELAYDVVSRAVHVVQKVETGYGARPTAARTFSVGADTTVTVWRKS